MKIMQLEEYANRQSRKLSGGNMRKLCVALALIGSPNVQFFDEPSTGIDPIARRYLWNSIMLNVKLRQSAIVLTTHQMKEADTLCNNIGILVNGKLQCIGSP